MVANVPIDDISLVDNTGYRTVKSRETATSTASTSTMVGPGSRDEEPYGITLVGDTRRVVEALGVVWRSRERYAWARLAVELGAPLTEGAVVALGLDYCEG